ncbi:MAG: efflux RND transporter permease subunit, partial [Pseudomonadota bacterium]
MIALIGTILALRTPLAFDPPQRAPRLALSIQAPGITAATLERQVTRPLEVELASELDLVRLVSRTLPGEIYFQLTFASLSARQRAEDRMGVASARWQRRWSTLVTGIDIARLSSAPNTLEYFVAGNDSTLEALTHWTSMTLLPAMRGVPGVQRIEVLGAPARDIDVIADGRRLAG